MRFYHSFPHSFPYSPLVPSLIPSLVPSKTSKSRCILAAHGCAKKPSASSIKSDYSPSVSAGFSVFLICASPNSEATNLAAGIRLASSTSLEMSEEQVATNQVSEFLASAHDSGVPEGARQGRPLTRRGSETHTSRRRRLSALDVGGMRPINSLSP